MNKRGPREKWGIGIPETPLVARGGNAISRPTAASQRSSRPAGVLVRRPCPGDRAQPRSSIGAAIEGLPAGTGEEANP